MLHKNDGAYVASVKSNRCNCMIVGNINHSLTGSHLGANPHGFVLKGKRHLHGGAQPSLS
jgi:hypothetical protein